MFSRMNVTMYSESDKGSHNQTPEKVNEEEVFETITSLLELSILIYQYLYCKTLFLCSENLLLSLVLNLLFFDFIYIFC